MAPTLLHVGGDALQLPVLRWAREAGLELVVTDGDPEAPGARLASRFEAVAEDSVDELVELARGIEAEAELIGAYAASDAGLPAVAAIGDATGVPANAPAAVACALDRARSLEAWRAHDVQAVGGRLVQGVEELRSALDELGLPAVVQPADARVRGGQATVRDEPEAGDAFAEARAHDERVLVSGWLAGMRLGVNALFRDGAYVPCGVHERFLAPAPHRLVLRGLAPCSLDREQRRSVHALVERAARALEITAGPLMADVVWTDAGPRIAELRPRFQDAATTLHLAPLVYGKSPAQAWLAALAEAGGPFDSMPTEPHTHAGWTAIVPETPGVLLGVAGVDRARAVRGVTDVVVERRPGHEIRGLGDASAVLGYAWATGWDAKEVQERLRAARERIKVEVEWRSAA